MAGGFFHISLLAAALNIFGLNTARLEIGTEHYHSQGFKGKNVIIGIVDDVDITFNDFRDPATGKTRVLAYKRLFFDSQGIPHWDIWTRERIDSLLAAKYPPTQYHQYDSLAPFHNRANNHGTVIANILAGNGTSVKFGGAGPLGFVGMAPECNLVIVSGPTDSSVFFIDSVAASHGLPWVANMSWTTGPTEEIKALLGKNVAGKVLVVAAGNDNFRNYKRVIFAQNVSVFPLRFSLNPVQNFQTLGRVGGKIQLIYQYLSSINIISPKSKNYTVRLRTQGNSTYNFLLDSQTPADTTYILSTSADTTLIEQVNIQNGPAHWRFRFNARTVLSGDWFVDIIRPSAASVEIMDLAISWETLNSAVGIVPPLSYDSSLYTLVDLAVMDEVITVGGNYNYIIPGTIDTNYQKGDICHYSAVGPTFDGRLKPDLVAPGHGMATLAVTNKGDTNSISNLVFRGTSFSAPLVTGAVALLMEEDSTRTMAEILTLLKDRAVPNAFSGLLPNTIWGHGILRLTPDIGIENFKKVAPLKSPLTASPNPFTANIILSLHHSPLEKPGTLSIFNLKGQRVFSNNFANHPDNRAGGGNPHRMRWDAAGLPGGVYLIRAEINKKIFTLKVIHAK